MTRRLKPNLPITYYHVVTRCAQQMYWLENPAFKQLFVALLNRFRKIFYVDVLAYVMMDTHLHLCLAVHKPAYDEADIQRRFELSQDYLCNPRPFHGAMAQHYYDRYTDLSSFVGILKWYFSRRHNKIMETTGTFWEGPFKSIVIEDDAHLMHCLSYIELNPVRAQIVALPEDFAYCSAHHIKTALENGEKDPTPAVSSLSQLPDDERGEAYLALNRFLARVVLEGADIKQGIPRHRIPEFLSYWLGSRLLNETLQAFSDKRLSRWGSRVYGSEAFTEQILGQANSVPTSAGRSASTQQGALRGSATMAPT